MRYRFDLCLLYDKDKTEKAWNAEPGNDGVYTAWLEKSVDYNISINARDEIYFDEIEVDLTAMYLYHFPSENRCEVTLAPVGHWCEPVVDIGDLVKAGWVLNKECTDDEIVALVKDNQ